MYSLGDNAKNAKSSITHIEGDPDHPVNRGTLCPKGTALIDYVASPGRLKVPEVREPGTKEWKRISWDEAIDRVARLMKADRDANFQAKNADGAFVNRWLTRGFSLHRHRAMSRDTSPTRWSALSAYSPLTIRPGSDTAPPWPVWPQLTVGAP